MDGRIPVRQWIALALVAIARAIDPGITGERRPESPDEGGTTGDPGRTTTSPVEPGITANGPDGRFRSCFAGPDRVEESRPGVDSATVTPVPQGIDPATEPRVEVSSDGPAGPGRTAAVRVETVLQGDRDDTAEDGAWSRRRHPIEVEY